MDDWEKFNEIILPAKRQDFHSNLNREDIRQRVFKDCEVKVFGEYYDLHLKSDVLLLADIFETCI